jgi:hypothetical protein
MAKVQGQMQIEQTKEQNAQQRAMAEISAKEQADIAEANATAATNQHLNELEAQRRAQEIHLEDQASQREAERAAEQQRAQWDHEERLAKINGDRDIMIAERKAMIAKEQAIEVARISAQATTGEAEEARAIAEADATDGAGTGRDDELHGKMDDLIKVLMNVAQQPKQDLTPHIAALSKAQAQHGEAIGKLHKAVTAEREIVRDPKTGKPSGVRVKVQPADIGRALQ